MSEGDEIERFLGEPAREASGWWGGLGLGVEEEEWGHIGRGIVGGSMGPDVDDDKRDH